MPGTEHIFGAEPSMDRAPLKVLFQQICSEHTVILPFFVLSMLKTRAIFMFLNVYPESSQTFHVLGPSML